jgi:hypothetical protein
MGALAKTLHCSFGWQSNQTKIYTRFAASKKFWLKTAQLSDLLLVDVEELLVS